MQACKFGKSGASELAADEPEEDVEPADVVSLSPPPPQAASKVTRQILKLVFVNIMFISL